MHLKRYVHYSNSSSNRLGQRSDKEREELVSWVERCAEKPGPIVEIGTLFGYSTQALCEGVLKSGVRKTVYTVDNYSWNPMGLPPDKHRAFTRYNLLFASRLTDLVMVDSAADDFYRGFDLVPAFVFIDADHGYESVRKDLLFFRDIGARAIAGHDYNFAGVSRAVKEVLGEENLTVFDGTLFLYAAP